ncbi:MAG: hypothetical protein ACK5R1_11035 [Planctomycetota bacterium]
MASNSLSPPVEPSGNAIGQAMPLDTARLVMERYPNMPSESVLPRAGNPTHRC